MLAILLLASIVSFGQNTPVRSVSALPATCNPGSGAGGTPADQVSLWNGSYGIPYYCEAAPGTWATFAAQLSLSTTSLTFGSTPVNSSSQPQVVTLTSGGTAPVSITSILISGTNAGDFSQTNNCPASLSTTCAVSVVFSPSVGGSRGPATITVASNAVVASQTVSLSGTGATNPISLSSVAITPASGTCALPCSQQFTATGTYTSGPTQNLTTITGLGGPSSNPWNSSNTGDLTLSSGGLGTGVAAGSPTVQFNSATFNQGASGSLGSGSAVSFVFPRAQITGGTNVCFVRWQGNGGTVSSVTDTAGNSYVSGTLNQPGTGLSQQAWYANQITAYPSGQNIVAVTLSTSETSPEVQCQEFEGVVASGPLDAANNAHGNSSAPNGAVTTANAVDAVLVGLMVITGNSVTASGSGWTQWAINTTQGNTILATDTFATGATGPSPTLASSGQWLENFIALKAVPGSTTFTVSGTAPLQLYIDGTNGGTGGSCGSSSGAGACKDFTHMIASSAYVLGVNGTVVNVAAGTYTDSQTCGSVSNVTLCANLGGSSSTVRFRWQASTWWMTSPGVIGSGVKLRPTGTQAIPVWIDNATTPVNHLDIVGFDIQTTTTSNINVLCPYRGSATLSTQCNDLFYAGNYIHDGGQTNNGGNGCAGTGIITENQHGHYSTGVVFEGNLIVHLGTSSPTCNQVDGIYSITQGSVLWNNISLEIAAFGAQVYDNPCLQVISNNDFMNNGWFGLELSSGPQNTCANSGDNAVLNNINDNNGTASTKAGFDSQSGDCSTGHTTVFTDNNAAGNSGGQFSGNTAACDIKSGTTSEAATTSFVNYTGTATGNYTLNGSSSLVGSGTTTCNVTTPCIPPIDFFGFPRPSPPSVGAIEKGSSIQTWPWY